MASAAESSLLSSSSFSTQSFSSQPSTTARKLSADSSPQPKGGTKSSSSPRKSGGSKDGKRKSSSSSHDPMAAVIAGVVIGVVAFAVLMALVACVCCSRRRKKKTPPMNMPFYTDEKGNVYYPNAGMPPPWQQHPSNNGHMPPPPWQQYPSNNSHIPPPPPWQQHPVNNGHIPPPPALLSGEMGPYSSGPHGPLLPPPSPNVALGFSKSYFTYEELAAATSGFSHANLLGQGGFGYVYRGVLAGSGKEVAVKQLKSGSGQGEREFQAEVEIISRVHHRHLVSLVGYCIAGSQRLLVYEFVPNNTLEHHLHGKAAAAVLGWPARHKIALGAAKGLAYLHEDCHPRIIHRDIKAANILLDANFEAMVADFGLAKLTTDTNTHVSTRVMGTFGYLAPEYAASGKLTDRSDVFSFGVMLLELITGRRPIDTANHMEDSLVEWARPMLGRVLSGEVGYEELVDARLEGEYSKVEVERMAASAAACIRHSARRRPKMSQIVRALEGDVSLEDLHEGAVKPGQSMLFSSGSDSASHMARLRQLAFDSGDFTDDYSTDSSSTRRN